MWKLAALKEREPGDDLMSRLITDYVAKGELSRETAVMNCVILLQAGHETTASMISLGTVALLQHPDALERLRHTDDPVSGRQHRRGVDALPDHRAHPGGPCRP